MSLREYLAGRQDDLLSKLAALSGAVDHHGERGEDLETYVRDLLSDYLPAKYRVDTGFVCSLEDPEWISSQIDLLITRADFGHPLATLRNSRVYPIEAVSGFMEVTKRLDRDKLKKDFIKIKDLKQKTRRTYVLPYSMARFQGIPIEDNPDLKDTPDFLKKAIVTIESLEPRFYCFAFESDWAKPESLCRAMKELGNEHQVHCHGLFIPKFGFFFHKPVAKAPSLHDVKYTTQMPDAFVAFFHQLLESLQSFVDFPSNAAIPIDRYGALAEGAFTEYSG